MVYRFNEVDRYDQKYHIEKYEKYHEKYDKHNDS